MRNKKILFIINGLGLGNASRCMAVIDNLPKEVKVDLLLSGKAVEFYQGWQRGDVFYQDELSYPEKGFGLYKTISANLKNIIRNIKKQKNNKEK